MLQGSSTLETRHLARELKFLVPFATGAKMLAWARGRLAPDPHASGEFADEYHTTSLYFDTKDLDVYHRRGSFGRCKYRIRQYGGAPHFFLERKLRTGTVVIKRRTTVGEDGLQQLALADPGHTWPGGWFQRRLDLRKLGPMCQVSYRRIARVGMAEGGPMRLTCDQEIRARQAEGLAFLPDTGTLVVDGQFVVELKYRSRLPAVFKQFVEEFALQPGLVSKYRLSLEALGKAGGNQKSSQPASADQVDIVDA